MLRSNTASGVLNPSRHIQTWHRVNNPTTTKLLLANFAQQVLGGEEKTVVKADELCNQTSQGNAHYCVFFGFVCVCLFSSSHSFSPHLSLGGKLCCVIWGLLGFPWYCTPPPLDMHTPASCFRNVRHSRQDWQGNLQMNCWGSILLCPPFIWLLCQETFSRVTQRALKERHEKYLIEM